MASLVIDAAVTALVHDRLRVLADALGRKQGLGTYAGARGDPTLLTPVRVGTTERQIAELARRALAIFEGGPRGPIAPGAPHTGTPRTGGTSKLAILGSAATALPALSDVHLNRRAWLAQVLRRGAPDPAQSRVVSPAIEAAFTTAERALGNAAGDAGAAAAARAFAMGMLCGVASDVVVGPLLRGGDAGGAQAWIDTASPEIDPAMLARVESAVRRQVFGGASTGQFLDYWPDVDQFGAAVRGGFVDAVTAAALPFGSAADPARLPITADGLHDSYKLMRAAMTSWDWYAWLPWLLCYTVPIGVILPLAAAFPESNTRWRASRLFRPESPGVDGPGEVGWSQLTSLALAGSTIGPAITTAWLWLTGVPGMEGALWLGTAAFALDAIGAVLLAVSADDGNWGQAARWVPPALQAAMRAVFVVLAITESGPVSTYYWIQTIPLWTSLAAMLVAWLADAITNDRNADGSTHDADRNRGIVVFGWPIALLAVQVYLAIVLDGRSLVSALLGKGWNRLPDLGALTATDPPYALARVFDEATLWSARPAAAPQSVLDLRYPPGSRPLISLWWTGTAGLQISHAGRTLRFRLGATGAVQTLAVPPGAKTPAELATWLAANVAPGGAAGQLHARPALAGDTPEAAHRLPWPEVVEDIGGAFRDVGDAAHPYTLNHAARRQLAASHGQRGPAVALGEGWPIAPGAGRGGADGTGVGMAAELGVLLALGGASRFHDAAAVPATAPPIGRVSQVFRRWNLDERRANEWRMLIGGGAASEKPPRVRPAPSATETVPVDDALPPNAVASHAVASGSEDLANLLGWVPLLRAWTRVATDVEHSATADVAAPYNPVIRRDGRWVQPTNRQLDEAIRYLLDL